MIHKLISIIGTQIRKGQRYCGLNDKDCEEGVARKKRKTKPRKKKDVTDGNESGI